MASTTFILFTDRIFLGHYSVNALAASTPAGIASFMFIALFLGIVGYANTFIAQYTGAVQDRMVGRVLWQTVYLALLSGLLLVLLSAIGGPLFRLFGHIPEVQDLETRYFHILMWGAVFLLLKDGLSCFYSGRGLTRTVMLVNLAGAAVNIPLDYALIHGWGPFPAMGITGAGIASICGQALMALMFAVLIFRRSYDRQYAVLREWRFRGDLFMKLLRTGAPAGLHFFMDIFTFTFFIGAVGRLGQVDLAATNVTFSLNMLAFLPMIGVSVATNTLVGQSIGRSDPEGAQRAVRSTLHIALVWMVMVATLYITCPGPLIRLFQPPASESALFPLIQQRATVLLYFVAIYSLFDALNLVFTGALKGAGDTTFVGWTSFTAGILLLIAPVTIAIEILDANLYICWVFATLYICTLAMIFRYRFRQGRWRVIHLIEPETRPSIESL